MKRAQIYQDWPEVVNFEADVALNGASVAFYTAFPMCEAQFLMSEIKFPIGEAQFPMCETKFLMSEIKFPMCETKFLMRN